MYVLVSIISFVLLLLVLVGLHECGHFLTARAFGIRVTEFGFGFPPRLWSKRLAKHARQFRDGPRQKKP